MRDFAVAKCRFGLNFNFMSNKISKISQKKFAKYYSDNVDKIYRFVYYRTKHRQISEDITSQTFFKALKKFETFDEKKASFQVWIYRIARNTLYDYWRTFHTTSDIDDVFDLSSDERVEESVADKLEIEKIEDYLQTLSSEQRDIIIMRIWDDMSYADIASIMDKSEGATKMMFSRAINKLRETMPFSIYLLFLMKKFYE